jgi:ABC-type bacteriocin/lantibiotic exporter with double-glycine peptidase domain
MNNPYDRPRIYINWNSVRPKTLRGWLTLFGYSVVAIALIVLIAAIASTLLAIMLVVAVISAVWWFFAGLFARRSRDVVPYQGDRDA